MQSSIDPSTINAPSGSTYQCAQQAIASLGRTLRRGLPFDTFVQRVVASVPQANPAQLQRCVHELLDPNVHWSLVTSSRDDTFFAEVGRLQLALHGAHVRRAN